ncbi:MAG: hypothetical protein M3401_01585 [Actinomycetota bacterium]|nr:hypothetical protein [Actinomycetota bacterium]
MIDRWITLAAAEQAEPRTTARRPRRPVSDTMAAKLAHVSGLLAKSPTRLAADVPRSDPVLTSIHIRRSSRRTGSLSLSIDTLTKLVTRAPVALGDAHEQDLLATAISAAARPSRAA